MENIAAGSVVKEELKSTNSYNVASTSLDVFCYENNVRPTFIKMDIEGAEYSALKGSINVILTYRPKLAICIYHLWSDRWTIPILLSEYCKNYKFYLKKSGPYGETVLFAAPQKNN